MSLLNPTRMDLLVDDRGRPYFLWDSEMTLAEFEERLATGHRAERAYLVGKLMRQAKPDDVFQFTTLREIRELWPELVRHLGESLPLWTWLMSRWSGDDDGR